MANKLTKKKIDLLIEQAMNEDFTKTDLESIFAKKFTGNELSKGIDTGLPSTGANDVLNTLFSPPNNGKLSKEDIIYFIQNPKKIDVKVQAALIAVSKVGGGGSEYNFNSRIENMKNKLNNLSNPDGKPANKLKNSIEFNLKNKEDLLNLARLAEQALKNLENEISKAAQKPQSVSDSGFKTAGGDAGGFTADQVSVVERVLSKSNTITDKMKKLKQISETFYLASGKDEEQIGLLKEKKPSELLSEIQLIDLFNVMAKEIDAGAGAYVFEYFLAMIMGGKVSGKSKTSKGKMGAVDFQLGNQYGSAKYYQNAYHAKQSKNGFIDLYRSNNNKPVEVVYIISEKKQDIKQVQTMGAGTSDPARIIGMEIYAPVVVYDGKEFRIKDGKTLEVNKDGEVLIGRKLQKSDSIGMIYLTTSRTSTYREMIDSAIKTQVEGVQSAYEQFKLYFDSLSDASVQAKVYINKGDVSSGNQTYESLRQAEQSFEEMTKFLEYNDKPTKPVQENQTKSLKELDKLIEHVILNKMNK